MASQPASPRRLEKYLLFSVILFVVTYFVARGALELQWPMPVRVLFALLPLPAFGFSLVGVISGIKSLDELERKIHLEALAIAYPLVMTLLMILGLLQLAVPLAPEDWSYRHVWYYLPIFYFLGLTIARRRYA